MKMKQNKALALMIPEHDLAVSISPDFFTGRIGGRGVSGWAMACSNTFGLVTGAFLLGFGLSEIPKSIWRNADWTTRHKFLSHKIAKIALKLDDAHKELSNAIVVAQATSKQMSKRDPLRPYMDVIDNMLVQMLKEDPSFKPQGGRLGENDMDYDTDEKSMATLRRHLRRAREEYYRCKRSFMLLVLQKFVSSFRPERTGTLGPFLDMAELVWRCILQKQVEKIFAVVLGCMSAAILLAEATLLTSGVDLSLFSILVKSVGHEEVLVQTSAVSLLMICSMVARYAPPISYNFLNLISLAIPYNLDFIILLACELESAWERLMMLYLSLGMNLTKFIPLLWFYTILVASNFFDRIISFFGNWKIFRLQKEADDVDGFDPSGLLILQKERTWLEQGRKVGEHVIPLARNFNGMDIESGNSTDGKTVEMKMSSDLSKEDRKGSSSKPIKDDGGRYSGSKEAISSKYAAIREQSKPASNTRPVESVSSAKVSLLDPINSQSSNSGVPSGLASKWASMKQGFQTFKANIDAKKFIPLRQVQETRRLSRASSSESLDEIFQRLKRPADDHGRGSSDDDDDDLEIKVSGRSREEGWVDIGQAMVTNKG
ncbi:hypothetical protein Sango_0243000 [Sesamum angolense]|uniref:LMBR1-like membrane protein n=1 Tax=Sesamum angolense TaxID=2727404 RepID=A0AAE1XGY9_9LAMI|nr:hypothetical protein Sango_0243000 [Sesamum angolense]